MESFLEALTSPLDLSQALSRAYEVVSRLLAADYVALCISKPGSLMKHDWMVAAMPPGYLAHQHEPAEEDSVRGTVLRHPIVMLRGTEMISGVGLEYSLLSRRFRELGMPLEHVMAVLLDGGRDWHGCLMLYRDGHQPFSERERALVQRLTPMLTSTMRNCRIIGEPQELLGAGQGRGWMLEQLLTQQGIESIVLRPPTTERLRTPGATTLLESWFTPAERGIHGLPTELLERLELLASRRRLGSNERDSWTVREDEEKSLRVTFVPLPEQDDGQLWGLLLQEVSHQVPVPSAWRERLTAREVEVVECVLRGWDNQIIAEHLKCTIGTVKKHLQRIFDKLGVYSRKALLSLANRR